MINENYELTKAKQPELALALENTKIDEKLKLIKAKNGQFSLEYTIESKHKLIHSRYNPEDEAIKFINTIEINKTSIPVIIGFGLGYHINALLKRYRDFEHIYIIEPRFDVLKLSFDNMDLSEVLEQDNISFISSASTDFIVKTLSSLVNSPKYFKRIRLIIHTPSLDLYRSTHPQLAELIQRMNVDPKIQNIMKTNFGKNISLALRSPGINRYFGKFDKLPVLLISAGPSLVKDLEQIKNMQNKCLIISVTTCLKLLLDNDIRPDLISIGDPKQIMETHFEGIEDCDIPMIFIPTVCYKLLENYKGPKICALQNDYKHCDIIESKVIKGRVDVGESVATLNLDAAIKFACDPIIFVGQDLAFSDGHSHAAGIEKRLEIKHESKMVENVLGQMVPTSMSLMWFKDWFEKRIEKSPEKTYINVSQTGARIKGTIEMSLKEVEEKYCSTPIDKTLVNALCSD